ncbi:unnamed protein product [Rhizoctonia solani]|uniref:Uncharacterized protein n=1 Tax=Rhizoctonia solani TaxID=456999 RepID=A0A8H3CMY5_9AGAM|nr:unnamed protein product [Rhizoctonia solani]
MIPITQQDDGWYVNPAVVSESPRKHNPLPPIPHQFSQLSPYNSLGLRLSSNPPNALPALQPSLAGSSSEMYHASTPHPSGYVHALTNNRLSVGLPNTAANPLFARSPALLNRPDLSPHPSPTYPLRPIAQPNSSSMQSASSASIAQPSPPVPFAPQLPPDLPALSAPQRHIAALPAALKKGGHQQRKARKRKRAKLASPEDSGEEGTFHPEESRIRPNMLLAASHTAPTHIQSATQHLAAVRPVPDNRGSNEEINNFQHPLSTGDDDVVLSLYKEPRGGDVADLRKLCDMVHKLLEDQAELVHSVQQIDARTRQVATNPQNNSTAGGTYVSPPEPHSPINWDQGIQYDAPAGRRRRAERRVLIMGLIRETIFRLLSRSSVHDPLPPPPPSGLRVPTALNFGIRWQESEKSIFNRSAADVVAQIIAMEQPGMLSSDEAIELPSMVSKHIKYLCRCYKDQNRDDAEEFNVRRLSRCGAGTRKRQLFATRLQVLDMFPSSLGQHRHLIARLGVDGTSSDEEEPRGSGIYKIKNKPQLSSKITLLKRDLDHVYQLYFKGPGTKGNQVHRRIPSSINSTRPFLIQGLPLSCVSRAWYQGLDLAEKEFYQFSPHPYDFSFPTSLLVGERSRDVSP